MDLQAWKGVLCSARGRGPGLNKAPRGRDAGTEPTAVGGAVEPAHFPPRNPMKAFLGLQPRPLPELSRSTNTRGAGADRRGRGRGRAELSEREEVVAEPRGAD